MRKLLKALAVLVILVILAAGGGLAYLFASYPDVPPAGQTTLPADPESLARGRYLAEHVMLCIDCHSERDFTKFAGPLKPGTFGKGGERFDKLTAGVPGVIVAPNITPAGIGEYSDGELLRAVTTGVARDGRAMFPLMPYPNYGRMAEDDVKAALAYVKTLKPIDNPTPPRSLDVPLNLIVRTIPAPAAFAARPSSGDKVSYGEYMVRASGCGECHTPIDDRGQPLPGMTFAGGMQFAHPELGYRVRSANITPDADSGIGSWTEEQFLNKFKGMETPDNRALTDEEQRQNTAMPWTQYAGMTREDLSAIYAYLRTVKPVMHRVDKWPDAKPASATR
jgi:mono/diheme cytochrome c family protein